MSLDLYNFTSDKANIPIDVVFVHPVTGKDTDVVFHIVGIDSVAAQKCLDEQQAKDPQTTKKTIFLSWICSNRHPNALNNAV